MTDPRVACVLEALAEGASVVEAAQRAGVTRFTVYYWRRTRPSFRRRFTELRVASLCTLLQQSAAPHA